MNLDKTEKEVSPQRPRDGNTKIIEYTNFQLGSRMYLVDVHERDQSRFLTLHEGPYTSRMKCVAIPMSIMDKFIEKLNKVTEHIASFDPSKAPESSNPRNNIVFTLSLISPGGRKYYLDGKMNQSVLNLRISYIFNGSRNSVELIAAGVEHLVPLLDSLMKKHPSQTQSDDYPANPNRNRYQGPQSQRRSMFRVPFAPGYAGRGFRSASRQTPSYNGKSVSPKDGVDPKRNGMLKVVNDPEPEFVVNNAKKFTCEIVEGSKTFLRITEVINDVRKSTLHVPIESCTELHCVIGKMNQRYYATRKSPVDAPVV